jgi:hypothetical protein
LLREPEKPENRTLRIVTPCKDGSLAKPCNSIPTTMSSWKGVPISLSFPLVSRQFPSLSSFLYFPSLSSLFFSLLCVYPSLLSPLCPELSRKQGANSFRQTVWKINTDVLKPNCVRAQATTRKRSQSAITVAQQYRWFKTYEDALNYLAREEHRSMSTDG